MLRIGFTVLLWLLASLGTHGYLSFSDVRTILEKKVSLASMHTDIRPQNVQSIPTWAHWMFFFIQDFKIHDIENKLEVNTLVTLVTMTISLKPTCNAGDVKNKINF